MKVIIFCFLVLTSLQSFADGNVASYPLGFEATGIQFESDVLKVLSDQRGWYCLTIKYLKSERWNGLPLEMKSNLAKEVKFSNLLCNNENVFTGLVGPKYIFEKAYVDFVSLDLSIFFLLQATESLGVKDDLYDGLKVTQENLDRIRNWVSAQTGYTTNSYPNIYDKSKFSWTSAVRNWVLQVHMNYVK